MERWRGEGSRFFYIFFITYCFPPNNDPDRNLTENVWKISQNSNCAANYSGENSS